MTHKTTFVDTQKAIEDEMNFVDMGNATLGQISFHLVETFSINSVIFDGLKEKFQQKNGI